ncbi:MAG TPA: hypothetical protein V6D15_15280 [Oculatellaceae cyanobacterium]
MTWQKVVIRKLYSGQQLAIPLSALIMRQCLQKFQKKFCQDPSRRFALPLR